MPPSLYPDRRRYTLAWVRQREATRSRPARLSSAVVERELIGMDVSCARRAEKTLNPDVLKGLDPARPHRGRFVGICIGQIAEIELRQLGQILDRDLEDADIGFG